MNRQRGGTVGEHPSFKQPPHSVAAICVALGIGCKRKSDVRSSPEADTPRAKNKSYRDQYKGAPLALKLKRCQGVIPNRRSAQR